MDITTIDASGLHNGTQRVRPGNDPWDKRQRLILNTSDGTLSVEHNVPGGGWAELTRDEIELGPLPANLTPVGGQQLARHLLAACQEEMLDLCNAEDDLPMSAVTYICNWLDDHRDPADLNLARVEAASDYYAYGLDLDDLVDGGDTLAAVVTHQRALAAPDEIDGLEAFIVERLLGVDYDDFDFDPYELSELDALDAVQLDRLRALIAEARLRAKAT